MEVQKYGAYGDRKRLLAFLEFELYVDVIHQIWML